jgi:hypothetical protein
VKRRNFLAWLAAYFVAGVALLFVERGRLKERLLATSVGQRARESILGVDAAEGVATLTQEDETGLLKLAAAVLPSNAGEPSRDVVLDRLRWRATTGLGYATEFRRALTLLDEETQKTYGEQSRFVQLAAPQAEVVVGALLEGIVAYQLSAASTGDVVRLVVSPRFLRRYRMRRHVVNEILDAYYRSPLEWARLGYRSFPGACAGIVIYSQPPGPVVDPVAK